ncbi:MAG: hypothetical protein WCD69_19610 [Xanthobacteraceae bacterium]
MIIVGLGTVLSVLGLVLVRHYVDVRRLTANNEIAGHKFATIGVFYAVLLAFSVILVWQKFADAEADVVREAGAAGNIYRLSQGVTDKAGAALRGALSNYLKAAINDDWPAMDRGTTGAEGAAKQALDAVYSTLVSTNGQGDSVVVSEMLRQVDLVALSRRARLIASEGAVPSLLWLVLIGGAAITIGFTYFFGAGNLQAQMLMTALLAIMIFSELLVVAGIDRPFSGTVKVGPNALATVLADYRLSPQ